MPEEVHVEWESNVPPRLVAKLRGVEGKRVNRPILEIFQQRYIYYMNKLFETEGAWGGHHWAKLTEAWGKRKKALGFPTKIGYRTGTMWEALTGGPGFESKMTHDSAEFGIKSGVADYAQYFSETRSLAVNDRERALWVESAKLYYEGVVAQALAVKDARTKRISLPGGYVVSIGSDLQIRYHGMGGRFVSPKLFRVLKAEARSRKDAEQNQQRNR